MLLASPALLLCFRVSQLLTFYHSTVCQLLGPRSQVLTQQNPAEDLILLIQWGCWRQQQPCLHSLHASSMFVFGEMSASVSTWATEAKGIGLQM